MQQNDPKVVPISIAMPADMARLLRVLAAQRNLSRSQFVRDLLEESLPHITWDCREAKRRVSED